MTSGFFFSENRKIFALKTSILSSVFAQEKQSSSSGFLTSENSANSKNQKESANLKDAAVLKDSDNSGKATKQSLSVNEVSNVPPLVVQLDLSLNGLSEDGFEERLKNSLEQEFLRLKNELEQTALPLTDKYHSNVPELILLFHWTSKSEGTLQEKNKIALSSPSLPFGTAFELARWIAAKDFGLQKLPSDSNRPKNRLEKGVGFSLKECSVRTISLVSTSLEGHILLPIFAADELIIVQDAVLGNIPLNDSKNLNSGTGIDRTEETIRQAYKDIIHQEQLFSAVNAMFAGSPPIFEVETDKGIQYLKEKDLPDFQKEHLLISAPEKIEFIQGKNRFDADQLRHLGLAEQLLIQKNYLNETAVRVLHIAPEQIRKVPILEGKPTAALINLVGSINSDKVLETQLQISEALDKYHSNFICLNIDSPGGSLTDSLNLANFIVDISNEQMQRGHPIRFIAYIQDQAREDAALIALSCDAVFLSPKAVLGGEGNANSSEKERLAAVDSLQHSWAKKTGRSWSIPAAMINPSLEIFVCRNTKNNMYMFFSEKELAEQENPEHWKKERLLSEQGTLFQANGNQATEWSLARKTVKNFQEVSDFYLLQNDFFVMRPSPFLDFIRGLKSPGMSILLLVIAFMSLWGELKTPGLGLFGIMSAFCFLLFFWAHYLDGSATSLEILCFLFGVLLILLEIFAIPGFGVFGIMGGLFVIVSLVLASQSFFWPRNLYQWGVFRQSMLSLIIAFTGVTAVGFVLAGHLRKVFSADDLQARIPLEIWNDYQYLLGKKGIAKTPLVPSGKALIDNRLIDVLSDGVLIDPQTPIIVIDVQGSRITVKKIPETLDDSKNPLTPDFKNFNL